MLTTLLTTVGPSSCFELLLYGLAGMFFAGVTLFGILVFNRNSTHLEEVINSKKTGDDPWLIKLDRLMLIFFMAGVVLTSALGMFTGYNRMQRDSPMAQDNQKTPHVTDAPAVRSLSGIGRLAPRPEPSQSAETTASQGSDAGSVSEGQAGAAAVPGANQRL